MINLAFLEKTAAAVCIINCLINEYDLEIYFVFSLFCDI